MSKAIVLNEKFENNGEVVLPASYEEINKHNLYLYVKSYLAALRSNTARAKTRAEVSGGGKKPKLKKVLVVLDGVQKDLLYSLVGVKHLDLLKETITKKLTKNKKH